jgi:hypothetical protein
MIFKADETTYKYLEYARDSRQRDTHSKKIEARALGREWGRGQQNLHLVYK